MDKAASRIRLRKCSPFGSQWDYYCNATEAFLLKNMVSNTAKLHKIDSRNL